jgi:hypothetical protein
VSATDRYTTAAQKLIRIFTIFNFQKGNWVGIFTVEGWQVDVSLKQKGERTERRCNLGPIYHLLYDRVTSRERRSN